MHRIKTALHRILVVDDNRDSADSLGTVLRILGADVHIVDDGPSALHAVQTYHPSVALLDIGMLMAALMHWRSAI